MNIDLGLCRLTGKLSKPLNLFMGSFSQDFSHLREHEAISKSIMIAEAMHHWQMASITKISR
jgi:hypothetical protein